MCCYANVLLSKEYYTDIFRHIYFDTKCNSVKHGKWKIAVLWFSKLLEISHFYEPKSETLAFFAIHVVKIQIEERQRVVQLVLPFFSRNFVILFAHDL
jgi:hypothetical protein